MRHKAKAGYERTRKGTEEGNTDCQRVGLFSLNRKQLRQDTAEVYKITNTLKQANKELLFTISHKTRTKRHLMKPSGGRCTMHIREIFSVQHTTNLWSLLPQDVGEAAGITGFKKGLEWINVWWIDPAGTITHNSQRRNLRLRGCIYTRC